MEVQGVAELVAKSVFGDLDAKLLDYDTLRTPSSLVFRLTYAIGGTSQVLFVKLPAEVNAQSTRVSERLQREFSLSERVRSAFRAVPELDVISPAGFIDEIDGLVTWEVRGDSLQELFSTKLRFRYRRGAPDLEEFAHLCGKWLRRFHSLDLVEDDIDLRQSIVSYCGNRLDVLARTKKSEVSEALADSLKCTISAWVDEALSRKGTKIVLCHNDFSPHNIIVTEKGICVLDFGFANPGLAAFDLACFWHKLEDLKGSGLRGSKGVEAIQKSFLGAYGSDFHMTRPDVKLGLARLVLSKMVTLLGSGGTGLAGWTENRRRYSSYLALLESGFDSGRP